MDQIELERQLLKEENEIIKNQLMNNSIIGELAKVMQNADKLEDIIHTLCYGLQESVGFKRIIFFTIDVENFSLTPTYFFGIEEFNKENFKIPLGFDGGDISDAIFLNRHLITDFTDDEYDPFAKYLNSERYVTIPLTGNNLGAQLNRSSSENSKTTEQSSPTTITEDERRRTIITSPDFKNLGLFWLDKGCNNSEITSNDISMLSEITDRAGLIIENFTMYKALENANQRLEKTNSKLTDLNEELRSANDRINRDLDHARSIQEGLLPEQEELPYNDHIEITAKYIPAETVSGDYYDAFQIDDNLYGFLIADVSGHGVASALVMTMVKALLKTFMNKDTGPQKTLEQINAIFESGIKTSNFVTVFYAILNTKTNTMRYSSAGHCPILLINKKTKEHKQLKADGLFLGMFPDMMLKETEISYCPNENRMILYTDGITEARNTKNALFEIERLTNIAVQTVEATTDIACESIYKAQREFSGLDSTPEDDLTLLVIDF